MFCRFGVKVCHCLRAFMKILTTWLVEIEALHDRIYCRCCEPTYVKMTNFPEKGDLKDA